LKTLETAIEHWFAQGTEAIGNAQALAAFLELRTALEAGELRSAEPDAAAPLGWRVNAWVKRGILLGFRIGTMMEMGGETLRFIDKHTYPVRRLLWLMECEWCQVASACAREPMWRKGLR